ncbi:dGTPase [Citrobacter youngae]
MNKYLSDKRHRVSESKGKQLSFLAVTQSDRARLIYSAAFRRLQQKAQVFSLESNSAVRSRLTHSIEVSHIGRYIVSVICELVDKSDALDDEQKKCWRENSQAISNMVEISCLAHDIGNPPFGHFGEAAIKEWARSEKTIDALKKALGDSCDVNIDCILSDFIEFDGNPQGFRILTKLQGEDGYNGLNLTYSQLASFLKYTYGPSDKPKHEDNVEKIPFSKKIGYFNSEKDIIYSTWDGLGMPKNTRHPLGFLMEASDDISYCISDIEDGIEKDIIHEEHFFKFVIERLTELKYKYPDRTVYCNELIDILEGRKKSSIGPFLSFKTNLSNYLVAQVAKKFVDNYDLFLSLKFNKTIICKNEFEYDVLEILKDYTSENLFSSYEAEKMELSGFAIIKGILDEYLKILSLTKQEFLYLLLNDSDGIKENKLHIERRLFNRLPEKHLNAYKAAVSELSIKDDKWSDELFKNKINEIDICDEWMLRAHLIVDFVSGMTDQFSMEIYHLLRGIKIK